MQGPNGGPLTYVERKEWTRQSLNGGRSSGSLNCREKGRNHVKTKTDSRGIGKNGVSLNYSRSRTITVEDPGLGANLSYIED